MQYLIMFVVAMAISAIGFKKFVWFISIGYGFSIAGLGLAMLVMFRRSLNPCMVVLAVLCMVYGCRLGGYLLVREIKSASYQKTMKHEIKDGSGMKWYLKVLVWLSCALLYCFEVAPVFFRMQHNAKTDAAAVIGTVVMAF